VYIFRPEDSLEEFQRRLADMTGRPVLVAGCDHWGGEDTRYRYPEESRYHHVGRLELFTSPLHSNGKCVKSVGEGDDRIRYFDLTHAQYLHLIYPLMPDEKPDPWDNPHFKKLGFTPRLNAGVDTISLSDGDQRVPLVLQPFVAEYGVFRKHTTKPGVKFAVSEEIEAPDVALTKWHLGMGFGTKYYTGQTIQAPGRYRLIDGKSHALASVDSINRTCLVDTTPGQCVRCHGQSGERVHFAVVASSMSAYPDGLICRKCFPAAAAEWNELLQSWTPPVPPSTP